MSTILTRPEFDHACQAYALEQRGINNTNEWIWHQHDMYSLGFMSRRVVYRPNELPLDSTVAAGDDELEDSSIFELDEHVVANQPDILLLCDQYVCYSTTYQVPVFHFNLYGSDGMALTLTRILSTPFIKGANLPAAADISSFSLTPRDSSFPLLSQGDHPTLGTPSWYLHPCQTSAAVAELLNEGHESGDVQGSRWLRAWFAVLSTVVDLR